MNRERSVRTSIHISMCNYCCIVQYVTPALCGLLDVLQDVHISVGELEEEIQCEIHIESCVR